MRAVPIAGAAANPAQVRALRRPPFVVPQAKRQRALWPCRCGPGATMQRRSVDSQFIQDSIAVADQRIKELEAAAHKTDTATTVRHAIRPLGTRGG